MGAAWAQGLYDSRGYVALDQYFQKAENPQPQILYTD